MITLLRAIASVGLVVNFGCQMENIQRLQIGQGAQSGATLALASLSILTAYLLWVERVPAEPTDWADEDFYDYY